MNDATADYHYTCPDCPMGGLRWETPEALRAHIREAHADMWTDAVLDAEIAEQTAMYAATR